MTQSVTYDKHDEEGKFTPTYTPEDFIDAVESLDLPTTADVAEHVDCAHRTALHHLNQLEEDGRLTSRQVGRAKLWRVEGGDPDVVCEDGDPDKG